jgi:hypothetical protein
LVGNVKAEMAKVVFDLHLGFSILFKSEQDVIISQELVKGCSWALDIIVQNIDIFVTNPASVNKLLGSDMLIELFKFMELSTENTDRKRLISEIIIKLDKIFHATKKKNPENSVDSPPYKRTTAVDEMLFGYASLEHGRKFTSLMSKIKLSALLKDPRYSDRVSQFGTSYSTDKQMFQTYFKKTFTPTEYDVEVSVDQSTTKKAI